MDGRWRVSRRRPRPGPALSGAAVGRSGERAVEPRAGVSRRQLGVDRRPPARATPRRRRRAGGGRPARHGGGGPGDQHPGDQPSGTPRASPPTSRTSGSATPATCGVSGVGQGARAEQHPGPHQAPRAGEEQHPLRRHHQPCPRGCPSATDPPTVPRRAGRRLVEPGPEARWIASTQGRAIPADTSSARARTSVSTRARWTWAARHGAVRPLSSRPSVPRSSWSRRTGSERTPATQALTGQPVARPTATRADRSTPPRRPPARRRPGERVLQAAGAVGREGTGRRVPDLSCQQPTGRPAHVGVDPGRGWTASPRPGGRSRSAACRCRCRGGRSPPGPGPGRARRHPRSRRTSASTSRAGHRGRCR